MRSTIKKARPWGKRLAAWTLACLLVLSIFSVEAMAGGSTEPLPDYTGDWIYFRGNPENNGVTLAPIANSPETAVLKWAERYGTGWSAAPTPPVIVNGDLYIAMSNKVLKIDKETGQKISESQAMAGNVGFAMNPIAYGGGMLFVPLSNGRVQALRADTLESLWVSEAFEGLAQTVSPVIYHDGYVYTGIWSRETEAGAYFALSVTDEDPSSPDETKQPEWKLIHTGGFYWAGAYVTDDYLIVGSDDGSPEGTYTETAVLYSLNPKTGAVLGKIEGIKGDIRSSISYDKDTDRIYFATKGGLFCSTKVNADGTFDDSAFQSVSFSGMCTGTPMIYNGRAYIGSSGATQFGPGKLNVIDLSDDTPTLAYVADLPGYPQASALATNAYGDTAYVYITYNNSPGGIYAIEDKPGQTEAEGFDLFVPEKVMQQYCICSLVCDAEGTLYYKNDSGYLMAVESNTAYLTSLTSDVGKLDIPFSATRMNYELVVPIGTEIVTLTVEPCEDGDITINEEEPSALTLENGTATARITVSQGADTRDYIVKIREASDDALLSELKINEINTYNSSNKPLIPEFAADKDTYACFEISAGRTFVNLWPTAADTNASVKVYALDNVRASDIQGDGTLNIIATNNNHDRYALYFADGTKPLSVRVEVTAEDGAAKESYRLFVTKQGAADLSYAIQISLDKNSLELSSGTKKLTATMNEILGTGVAETLNWASSDENIATVDQDGTVMYVSKGVATVTVSGALTSASCTVNCGEGSTGPGGSTPTEKNISVSFRLIGSTLAKGDVNLSEGGYLGAEYQTWIKTKRFIMAKNSTVFELFTEALDEAGIRFTGANKNYVDTIYAPSILGGYKLSEFTNGQRSGWMYTVNGVHPSFGLKDWTLKDGDVVIWHYVNDYAHEVADWFDDPEYPALGDGTYYNKWLEAKDTNPVADSLGSGSADGQSETVVTPKVTAKNGVAEAAVSTSDMNKAIDDAKKSGSDAIVIQPAISGKAAKISVEVPKASVSSMASGTDADLSIITPEGSVTIPNGALAGLFSQAEGSTITIVVESKEKKNLTDDQRKLVGDNPVFDISIISGGKKISSFGGKAITISLPYMLKTGETADGVAIWYLGDDGKLERITCKYDAKTGLAAFTATHLSLYVVGYDGWINPFADVKTSDWFYDAVKYAAQNELFAGTSAASFSPNKPMTRSMLVTVLHRLDGKPAVTAANSFTDVMAGQWYTDAVIWANANNIVSGYGNGKFGTNDPITREQMAAILYRYAEYKGYDVTKAAELAKFTDAVSVSPWADSAMKWAVGSGLISGMTETTLAPTGSATRAQVASILMRLAEGAAK